MKHAGAPEKVLLLKLYSSLSAAPTSDHPLHSLHHLPLR